MDQLVKLAGQRVPADQAYQQVFGKPLGPSSGDQQQFLSMYASLGGQTPGSGQGVQAAEQTSNAQPQPAVAAQAPGTSAAVASQVADPGTVAGANVPVVAPPVAAAAAPGAAGGPAAGPTSVGAYSIPQGATELNRFGLSEGTTAADWGSKVFRNGNDALRDPNVASSPWGQFLLDHYGTQMQSNLALGLLNGGVSDPGNTPSFARDQLTQQAAGGGAAAGGLGALRDAANNLATFGSNGGQSTGNTLQDTQLAGLATGGPADQASLIRQAMHSYSGGWGQKGIDSILNSQYQLAQDNQQAFGPGQWMKAALGKLGVQ
jgi:hypothetical protein